jgi:glutamate 5-kinase
MTLERAKVARAKRIVVKIGSRTLAADMSVYSRLARAIAGARTQKRSVVLVSSGAIALGTKKLGYKARPKEMARLQAAAAAGQSVLMRAYEEALGGLGIAVAQVLLTHADLADRVRANNARAALAELLAAGAVPILNENDSVAVEEIKFGDNDQLSAMVAPLVDADLLVLLSDVAGLLNADGKRVSIVHDVATEAMPLVRATTSAVGTGGMASKLEAARRATMAGAHVVIADARVPDVLEAVLAGEDVGTLFCPSGERLSARRYWIAFTLRPSGDLILDAGAATAISQKGKSVLAIGVLGVRGDFREGDSVRLIGTDGAEIGRGLSQCSAAAAAARAGHEAEVLVHRDDLVLTR